MRGFSPGAAAGWYVPEVRKARAGKADQKALKRAVRRTGKPERVRQSGYTAGAERTRRRVCRPRGCGARPDME